MHDGPAAQGDNKAALYHLAQYHLAMYQLNGGKKPAAMGQPGMGGPRPCAQRPGPQRHGKHPMAKRGPGGFGPGSFAMHGGPAFRPPMAGFACPCQGGPKGPFSANFCPKTGKKMPPCKMNGKKGPAKVGPKAGPANPVGHVLAMANKIFDRVDANHDGLVNADEAAAAHKKHFEQILAKVDKDGDKAISKREAAVALTSLIKRFHSAHAAGFKCPGKCPMIGKD